jgi:hypothetical protein
MVLTGLLDSKLFLDRTACPLLRRKGDPDIIIVLLKFPGEAALEGRCRLD